MTAETIYILLDIINAEAAHTGVGTSTYRYIQSGEESFFTKPALPEFFLTFGVKLTKTFELLETNIIFRFLTL